MKQNALFPAPFTRRLCCSLFFILLALLFSVPVHAQTEDEMKMLQMYFKEDKLVVSPTRTPKLLSQVAENISIVTAEEIEAMNAHTVVEVLSRVPGIFITFWGEDFGSDGAIEMQGSEDRHVLVLLDGVPWNNLGGGNVITQTIPVGIIKRIEIIKGPASSSWGSSLGGVINIVTKDTGDSTTPSGSVQASYGERNTQDYRAEAGGLLGRAGYYLYAGHQESGGLRDERDYNNDSFYGKMDIPFSPDIIMSVTAGYSEPHIDYGDIPSSDLTARYNITRVYFAAMSLAASITDNLSLEGSFYTRSDKFVQETDELSTGDQFFDQIIDQDITGGSSRLMWNDNVHNAVLGFDISDGNLDLTLASGPSLQSWGSPARTESESGITKWAVYINDTITIGSLSITPGIRYDKNNVDGDFTSPSIGAAYKISEDTILRASIARGFTTPPLAFTEGGGLFLDPNPDLDPERVWSYQGGIESWIADVMHAKASVFHHDMKDALEKELYAAGPPLYNDLYFNKGEIKRDGVEIELKTAPVRHMSAKGGFAYVHRRFYFDEATSDDIYSINLSFRFDNPAILAAQLDGRYVWWDLNDDDNKYNTFIWDLNIAKNIFSTNSLTGKVFLTAHNLFDGSHYTFSDRKNPGRWVEGGLKISF